MADHQLNGAHYGPSIPPTRPQRRRHNAGCGFCSCILGCFRSCCGCMFNCILSLICRIIATIIILVAIFGFLFWLIVRPNALKFTVMEASLTQFNFTNNNTLHYDLSVNLTIRNPNRRVSVYYNDIETLSFYKDFRFGSQTLGKFINLIRIQAFWILFLKVNKWFLWVQVRFRSSIRRRTMGFMELIWRFCLMLGLPWVWSRQGIWNKTIIVIWRFLSSHTMELLLWVMDFKPLVVNGITNGGCCSVRAYYISHSTYVFCLIYVLFDFACSVMKCSTTTMNFVFLV